MFVLRVFNCVVLNCPIVVVLSTTLALAFSSGTSQLRAADALVLPADIQQALARNISQLNPISISFSYQLRSTLDEQSTLDRLNLTKASGRDKLLSKRTYNCTHQDSRYRYARFAVGDPFGKLEFEMSYDGTDLYTRIPPKVTAAQAMMMKASNISIPPFAVLKRTTEQADKFRRGNGDIPPLPGSSMEEFQYYLMASRIAFNRTGFDWHSPDFKSAITEAIQQRAELSSITEVQVEGRACVRIVLMDKNPIKQHGEMRDLMRASVKSESKERRDEIKLLLDEQRKLPALRKYVFYLARELQFAVLRAEEWYDPDVLLNTTAFSAFEELPGRNIWIPRKIVSTLHEFESTTELFTDSFLSEEWEVTRLTTERVDDAEFVLTSDATPGTLVNDKTAKLDGFAEGTAIAYEVPAKVEDLGGVIEKAKKTPLLDSMPGGDAHQADAQRSPTMLQLFIAGNLVLLVCVGLFWAWSRRKPSNQ